MLGRILLSFVGRIIGPSGCLTKAHGEYAYDAANDEPYSKKDHELTSSSAIDA